MVIKYKLWQVRDNQAALNLGLFDTADNAKAEAERCEA